MVIVIYKEYVISLSLIKSNVTSVGNSRNVSLYQFDDMFSFVLRKISLQFAQVRFIATIQNYNYLKLFRFKSLRKHRV